ncbi:NAD P-binding protein [Gloeophyllum trabeum ATCC 11539]|uniref:NAD P-binding protein n=1 Tax=Gloeophyllum trabeum (strain ATCC 11539 / FP-39264 / Madison 617) TaxID=670483 RepID=S7QNW5_GLOTA|nr:NAD P-binding protein [Gloeophyllum trabeum ATCC 11539]EPQ61266.1 NAD P-binding protein [Gloeophyllum trabeum ATCC 11539]
MNDMIASRNLWLAAGLSIPIILSIRRSLNRFHRSSSVPENYERVLVLGASSGIGRAIAHIYASRGARVCVVARREAELETVAEECRALSTTAGHGEYQAGGKRVIHVVADFAEVDDMVKVRTALETEWRGLDTLIVAAGVSALKPLLEVAGVEKKGKTFTPPAADEVGLQKTVEVTAAAMKGNYIGPLVAAVSLIPLLSTTSPSPSILLLSSLASVIPAPTRTLYGSTKSASLMLYQSLSIEHPSIHFSFVLPSTVEGNFRASAVDGGEAREADPNTTGLKREVVARRCVKAVDEGDGMVFLPWLMGWSQLVYWACPDFVKWRAMKKYNFNVDEAKSDAPLF